MLESPRLRYFMAVAEDLHFGRAADRLDVAQSALSRHIQELERELGFRLLNRGRRASITLTEPGKALYRDALIGMSQLERAVNEARRAARGEIGRVAIGYVASATFSGLLPRALERFRAGHPDVVVHITEMETPAQLAALRDGLIDVGILRPRKSYPPGVTATNVHREAMLLALASKHPLAARRLDLASLADQTFIIPQFDAATGFAEQLTQLALRGGFEPRSVVHVRDFLTAMTLAAGGYGVVPVPKCMLAINLYNLSIKPVHGFEGVAELAVACREQPASEAAAEFVRQMRRGRPAPASRS